MILLSVLSPRPLVPHTHLRPAPETFSPMQSIKFKKPEQHQPYTRLRTPEALALWDEMIAFYGDWTPDTLRALANMCNDCGIIAEYDRFMADPDLTPLEMTRLDLRRDRADKRYKRARQCLNLDVPPAEARPPVPASRYAGRG